MKSEITNPKDNQELLEDINFVLLQNGCDELTFIPRIEGTYLVETEDVFEALKNKRILIVDDEPNLIRAEFAALYVATGGSAMLLVATNETNEELARKILAIEPEILLLDGNMGVIYGPTVAQELLKQGYDFKIFAHTHGSTRDFRKVGVEDKIEKGLPRLLEDLTMKLHPRYKTDI